MLRDRAARRRAVTFALLVAACLMLLAVGRSAPAQELRRGVNFALAPVQDALSNATRSLTSVLGAVTEIDQLRRDNLALTAHVDELEDEVSQLQAVREENARLARLLRTQRTLDRETVAAQVIARQVSQFERGITLDRGTEAGIELGHAVLSDGGALAGSVVEVGDGYAAVRLLSDTRTLVIGRDATTRATGEVIGRLSAPLAMANIPVTEEVSVGDQVVTAGLSLGRRFRSYYPPGLLIGRIVDVQQEPGSIVQTALVEPAAELDRLEHVLVVTDYSAPRPPATEDDDEEA
jgi:rod shape-determining protein MreC